MATQVAERTWVLLGVGALLFLAYTGRRGMGGAPDQFPFMPGLPPGPIPIPPVGGGGRIGGILGGGGGGGAQGTCGPDNPELCIPGVAQPLPLPCVIDPLTGDCITVEQFPPTSPLGSNVIPDPSGIVGPRPITSP